ncbi:MAG: hypothetical protein ABII90_14620 [Bacteroidota bacterium]
MIYKVGANLFFGIKYRFSKRFSISSQVGIDIIHTTGKKIIHEQGIINNTPRVGTTEIIIMPLIRDVSLIFHF